MDGALVVNICEEELQVSIGEHEHTIPPGESVIIPRPTNRNDFNMTSIIFRKKKNGEWKVQSESSVRFPENQLQLFAAFKNSKQNKTNYKAYDLSDY